MDWLRNALAQLNHQEQMIVVVICAPFLVLSFGMAHYAAEVWELGYWRWFIRLVPLISSYWFLRVIISILSHLKTDARLRGSTFRLYLLHRLQRWLMMAIMPMVSSSIVYQIADSTLQPQATSWMATGITWIGSLLLVNKAFPVPDVQGKHTIIQGAQLLAYQAAQRKAEQLTQTDSLRFFWGGVYLPAEAATTHGLVWGAPGTGKTLMLLSLMKTVLPEIGRGYNHRAVIYDNKNQMLPYLRSLGLTCPIVICNPFDRRSVKLNLAQEVRDEAMALTLAQSLIPMDAKLHQPYFARTAQILLSGLIQALMELYPGIWTLRHLLLAAESAERIRTTLAQCASTQRYIEQHAAPDKAEDTLQNIISELAGKLEVYRPLAAAWERAEKAISLREWVTNQESILLLGYDQDRNAAASAANRIFLNLLTQCILGLAPNYRHPATKQRRFTILLDEFETLERVERMGKLLAEGRDRGVCGILGLHAWSEIKQHYGADGANSIIAQISNKVFLRVEDDETEAKVLKFFGSHKRYESSISTQHLPHGISLGSGESPRESPLLTSSELWDLPPPSPENGIQGFARTPWIGRYRMQAPFEIPSYDPYEVAYERRDPKDLRLTELTPAEQSQLALGKQYLSEPKMAKVIELPQPIKQQEPKSVPARRRAKAVTLKMITNSQGRFSP